MRRNSLTPPRCHLRTAHKQTITFHPIPNINYFQKVPELLSAHFHEAKKEVFRVWKFGHKHTFRGRWPGACGCANGSATCVMLLYREQSLGKVFFPLRLIRSSMYTWLYTLRMTNLWCSMFSKFVLYFMPFLVSNTVVFRFFSNITSVPLAWISWPLLHTHTHSSSFTCCAILSHINIEYML